MNGIAAEGERSGSPVPAAGPSLDLGIQGVAVIVSVGVAAFATTALICAMVGAALFASWIAGVAAATVAWWKLRYRSGTWHPFDVVALAVVVVGTVLSVSRSAEIILGGRDAGTYTLEAFGILRYGGLRFPGAVPPFDAVADLVGFATPGFYSLPAQPDVLYGQFLHVLPASMAAVGSVLGEAGVLATNALFGGVALLAFYGLARTMLGAGWSLVALLAMSMNAVFVYFSRAPFSETPALLGLLAGGLALLLARRRGSRSLFVIAGFLLGLVMLARLDGPFLLVSLGVLVGGSPAWFGLDDGQVRWMVRGMAMPTALAFIDLAAFAGSYLGDRRRLVLGLLILSAVATFGAAFVRKLPIRPGTGALLLKGLFGLVAIALLLRSWLWIDRGATASAIVEAAQKAEGVPVDLFRRYSESTPRWIAWYLGWPMMFLAVSGAFMARWGRDHPARVVSLLAAPFFAYLWRPFISPDHIWAMRRFLPAVIPWVIIVATLAAASFSSLVGRRTRSHRLAAVSSAALAVALLVPAAWGAWPIIGHTEGAGIATAVHVFCADMAPFDGVVVHPDLAVSLVPVARNYCGIPTAVGPRVPEGLVGVALVKPGSSRNVPFRFLEVTVERRPSRIVGGAVSWTVEAPR